MKDEELLIKQGQRRADQIIANLISNLSPDAKTRELYFPDVNPRLYSHYDADIARRRILERDNYTCIYCGKGITDSPELALHVDHIVPLSRGGSDAIGNLVVACESCNSSKYNKMLDAKTQERILKEVARRNREQGLDGSEHLHALGANRREKRKGRK